MEGKQKLNNYPKEVKDIIIKRFNSIDDFYDYVILLTHNQYVAYKETEIFDNSKFEQLKNFLNYVGIDLLFANELVEDISADYEENIFLNNIQPSFGDDWEMRKEGIEKVIEEYLNS